MLKAISARAELATTVELNSLRIRTSISAVWVTIGAVADNSLVTNISGLVVLVTALMVVEKLIRS